MNTKKINEFQLKSEHEERFFAKLLLQNKRIKRRKQIRYISFAASIMLLIALPLYFFLSESKAYIANSPFPEEVQEIIQSYQAQLDKEIAEIKKMACSAQMYNEIEEIKKINLPEDELAILPVEKQIYHIVKMYNIKIEAVKFMQTVCKS